MDKLPLSIALALSVSVSAFAAETRRLVEVKKIAAPAKLKQGEGALRLSVRAQVQTIDTLFVYFVEVREDGSDGERVLRFERGAGVPIMGSNMIDPKPQVYRVPAGRYRPLAFTIKCGGLPFEGAVCSSNFGGGWPTGYYARSEAFIVVEPGKFSDGGDIVVEYNGTIADPRGNVFTLKKQPFDYDIRWRALAADAPAAFGKMPQTGTVAVPERFRSRITCERRPEGVLLYIPFAC